MVCSLVSVRYLCRIAVANTRVRQSSVQFSVGSRNATLAIVIRSDSFLNIVCITFSVMLRCAQSLRKSKSIIGVENIIQWVAAEAHEGDFLVTNYLPELEEMTSWGQIARRSSRREILQYNSLAGDLLLICHEIQTDLQRYLQTLTRAGRVMIHTTWLGIREPRRYLVAEPSQIVCSLGLPTPASVCKFSPRLWICFPIYFYLI